MSQSITLTSSPVRSSPQTPRSAIIIYEGLHPQTSRYAPREWSELRGLESSCSSRKRTSSTALFDSHHLETTAYATLFDHEEAPSPIVPKHCTTPNSISLPASPVKRFKTTNEPCEYELFYFPQHLGRGEFIRLMFEAVGKAYIDTAQEEDEEVALTKIRNTIENSWSPIPTSVLPVIRHGNRFLYQTPNILQYLASQLHLKGSGLHAPLEFELNQIVMTLLDGFIDELQYTYHPVSMVMETGYARAEAKDRARKYFLYRMPRVMHYAQQVIDENNIHRDSGPWMAGREMTYADLVLFQVSCMGSFLYDGHVH